MLLNIKYWKINYLTPLRGQMFGRTNSFACTGENSEHCCSPFRSKHFEKDVKQNNIYTFVVPSIYKVTFISSFMKISQRVTFRQRDGQTKGRTLEVKIGPRSVR